MGLFIANVADVVGKFDYSVVFELITTKKDQIIIRHTTNIMVT